MDVTQLGRKNLFDKLEVVDLETCAMRMFTISCWLQTLTWPTVKHVLVKCSQGSHVNNERTTIVLTYATADIKTAVQRVQCVTRLNC